MSIRPDNRPRDHRATNSAASQFAVRLGTSFNMESPGVTEMMVNWFYLVGSICFVVGTIISMTAQ